MSVFIFLFGWILGTILVYLLHQYYSQPPLSYTKPSKDPEGFPEKASTILSFNPFTISAIGLIYGILLCTIFNSLSASEAVLTVIWLTSGYLLSITDLIDYSVPACLLYPGLAAVAAGHLLQGNHIHWHTLLIVLPMFGFVLWGKLGDGDVLLLIGWAPWLALSELAWLLLIASGLGMVVFALYYVIWRWPIHHLPFVPFLSLGLCIVRLIPNSL